MTSIPKMSHALTWQRFFLTATLVSTSGFEVVRGDDDRLHIPNAAALRKATAKVADVFEARASEARSLDERAAVARGTLAVLPSTKDPAERYAIQLAAIDTATRGNDPRVVLAIADMMSREYQAERVALIIPRITKLMGQLVSEAWMAAAPKLHDEAWGSISASRFSAAERREAERRLADLVAAEQRSGADPKKFTELERELCLVRGDWSTGLPYLSRADDADLAAVAEIDITTGAPQQRLAVAQAWATLGSKQLAGYQEVCFDRAATVFTVIRPSLSGLENVKPKKAYEPLLESANTRGRAGTPWIVIFRSADPRFWNSASRTDPMTYAGPFTAVPAKTRYVRLCRPKGDAVMMPLTKAAIGEEWEVDVYGWQNALNQSRALGAFDMGKSVDVKIGKVAIYSGPQHDTDWEFVHRVRHGGPANGGWGNEFTPIEPIEISVAARCPMPGKKWGLLS